MTGPPPLPTRLPATPARILLPRTGASLATAPLLDLRLAHARARDAVHTPLDEPALLSALPLPALVVDSQAPDRRTFLMRPDLGRTLAPSAHEALAPHQAPHDLVIVIADGLSAQAPQRHAAPLLRLLLPTLTDWRLAPLVIVRQARVAAADAVAQSLGARSTLILLGERPGLSAPDSLGAYLTWSPTPRTTDADRNCISNIRPEGLRYEEAAHRLHHLLTAMRARRLTGTALKDESATLAGTPSIPPEHVVPGLDPGT